MFGTTTHKKNKKADFKVGIVGNGSTPGLIEFLDNEEFDWISIDKDKDKKFFIETKTQIGYKYNTFSVEPISKGVRFTLCIWFGKFETDTIEK